MNAEAFEQTFQSRGSAIHGGGLDNFGGEKAALHGSRLFARSSMAAGERDSTCTSTVLAEAE